MGILCLQEPVLWSAALPTFPAHDTELLPVWVSSCAPSTLRCHGRTELAKHGLRPLHSAPWETILHTDGLLPQSGCMVSRCRPPQAVCSCFFFFFLAKQLLFQPMADRKQGLETKSSLTTGCAHATPICPPNGSLRPEEGTGPRRGVDVGGWPPSGHMLERDTSHQIQEGAERELPRPHMPREETRPAG